jgi:hypothetical protein
MKWELLTSSEITLPKKHKDDQKNERYLFTYATNPKGQWEP